MATRLPLINRTVTGDRKVDAAIDELRNAVNALIRNGTLEKTGFDGWAIAGGLPPTAVVAGSYVHTSITVQGDGRLTAAASGHAYETIQANTSDQTQRPKANFSAFFTITDSASPARTNIDLAASGVVAASYTNANITVDAKGRVTSAANGSASGISPLTTKSDIWAYSSTDARFPGPSVNTQIIVAKSSTTFGFQWVTPSGDITTDADGVFTIGNDKVTLAKIQNASANSKLLGSGASGSGADYSEITLGSNLSMSGTTLNVATGLSSPLTTKGDMWVFSTVDTKLAVGTGSNVLLTPSTGAGTGLAWDTISNVIRGKVGGSPIVIVKTGDTNTASDATSNNDPDLVFAIGANETWTVQYYLFVTGNGSADIRIALSTPTACAGAFTSFGLVSTATTSGNLQTDGDVISGGQTGDHGTAAPGAGTTIGLLAWAGVINGANAGNVQFMWAQISSNINNVTLMKGSFLVAHRVA